MDIITEPPSEVPPSQANLGEQNYVVGVKQLKKALRAGSALRVYVAQDADPRLTDEIVAMCKAGNVPFHWVDSMEELGNAFGISVGAAAAATVK